MKRLMIAATALLGLSLSGAVAQDEMMAEGPSISLSGSAGLGATFKGATENAAGTKTNEAATSFNHFAKVTLTGSGVTDGGLTFGAKVRVNTDKVDDAEVHIGGESWTLTVGDVDPASELAFSLGDVGFDGNLGVDDVAEKFAGDYGVKDVSDARLDLSFGVAKIAVSVGVTPGTAYQAATDASATHKVTTKISGLPAAVASPAAGPAGDAARQSNADRAALLAFFGKDHSLTFTSLKDQTNILDTIAPSGYYLTRPEGSVWQTVSLGTGENIVERRIVEVYQFDHDSNPSTDPIDVYTLDPDGDDDWTNIADGMDVPSINAFNAMGLSRKMAPVTDGTYNIFRIKGRSDKALDAVIAAARKAKADFEALKQGDDGYIAPGTARTAELNRLTDAVSRAEADRRCETGAAQSYTPVGGESVQVCAARTGANANHTDVQISDAVVTASGVDLTAFTAAMAEKMATKQKTNWALGTSVAVGPTTLGFGIDSEKKLQASVGASFGDFGGSIFYAQQDADTPSGEKKLTGLGGEFTAKFDATSVNIVAARATMDGAADSDGFGAGVKHDLGGGATVEAGLAQVEDRNMASVGVTMSF